MENMSSDFIGDLLGLLDASGRCYSALGGFAIGSEFADVTLIEGNISWVYYEMILLRFLYELYKSRFFEVWRLVQKTHLLGRSKDNDVFGGALWGLETLFRHTFWLYERGNRPTHHLRFKPRSLPYHIRSSHTHPSTLIVYPFIWYQRRTLCFYVRQICPFFLKIFYGSRL